VELLAFHYGKFILTTTAGHKVVAMSLAGTLRDNALSIPFLLTSLQQINSSDNSSKVT